MAQKEVLPTVRVSGAGGRGVRLQRPAPGCPAAALAASFIFSAAEAATCQRERRKRRRQQRQASLAGRMGNSREIRSAGPASSRPRAGGGRLARERVRRGLDSLGTKG